MDNNKGRPAELPALTIARFFAAFAVLAYHFGQEILAASPAPAQNVVKAGYLGVPFFFILSGFVLVYAMNGRAMAFREFIMRRVARIYPVYLLAWALFLALVTYRSLDEPLREWIQETVYFGGLALFLVQSWVPGAAETWNSPGWSLSCEALFYVLFPLLTLHIGRLSTRALLLLLGALLVVNAPRFYLVHFVVPIEVMGGNLGTFLYDLPALQLVMFAMGVTLGHLYLRLPRLPSSAVIATVSAGLIVALLMLVPVRTTASIARDGLVCVLFCVLIYSLAGLNVRGPRTWVLLGHASYALYILQLPVWYIMRPDRQSAVSLLVYAAALIGVSILSTVYFERPVEKWIKNGALNSRPPALIPCRPKG